MNCKEVNAMVDHAGKLVGISMRINFNGNNYIGCRKSAAMVKESCGYVVVGLRLLGVQLCCRRRSHKHNPSSKFLNMTNTMHNVAIYTNTYGSYSRNIGKVAYILIKSKYC